MRKVLIFTMLIGFVGVISIPVQAEEEMRTGDIVLKNGASGSHNYILDKYAVEYLDKDVDTNTHETKKQVTEVNAYFNAPYLIRFTDNIFVGGYTERNINQTNSKEKPVYGLGITYQKTAFDLRGIWPWSKKK